MSYYVHTPYFFANVTDKSFEATTFGRIFVCNHILSSASGLILFPIVFYMVIFKSPSSLSSFRKILMITHSFDLLDWLIYSFGLVRLRFVNNVGLLSFSGPITFFSFDIQLIGHCLNIGAISIPFVTLPLPLWYRDHILRYGTPSNWSLVQFISVIFALLFSAVFLSTLAVLKADRSIDYGRLWYQELPIPPLAVLDSQQSSLVFISSSYAKSLFVGGFLVAVFIACRSYCFLKQKATEVNQSRCMDQYTRLVFINMLIPTLGLFVPLTVTLISTSFEADDQVTQNLLIFILAWIPSINSITTLIFIVPYRQAIVYKLKQIAGHEPQSSVSVNPISKFHAKTLM
ncbi:hypothetical protein M3Y94_00737100 [Aphelenchoides besseyi]|nr:hypothetical protein M3Y94_00737100 [Aphelenchoides besseyi]KAI6231944.1 hypothetical protein M3Y95_00435000 [Aphelenchoides besseyi]